MRPGICDNNWFNMVLPLSGMTVHELIRLIKYNIIILDNSPLPSNKYALHLTEHKNIIKLPKYSDFLSTTKMFLNYSP